MRSILGVVTAVVIAATVIIVVVEKANSDCEKRCSPLPHGLLGRDAICICIREDGCLQFPEKR